MFLYLHMSFWEVLLQNVKTILVFFRWSCWKSAFLSSWSPFSKSKQQNSVLFATRLNAFTYPEQSSPVSALFLRKFNHNPKMKAVTSSFAGCAPEYKLAALRNNILSFWLRSGLFFYYHYFFLKLTPYQPPHLRLSIFGYSMPMT